MSNEDDPPYISKEKTRPLPKNKQPDLFVPEENLVHDNLDPTCLYKFDETLLRIEYPGHVRNVDKALETLGGIRTIQTALEQNKLELQFHPGRIYSLGCMSYPEHRLGLLVKVKRTEGNQKCSYEILGAVDTCFEFNRMYDFQYLPIVPKEHPEKKDSEAEFIYNRIIIDTLPTLEWFTKKETASSPLYLVTNRFARFDQPQHQFRLGSIDAFNAIVRHGAPSLLNSSKTNKEPKPTIVSTQRVALNKVIEVPTDPTAEALEHVQTNKYLHNIYLLAKKAFDERPIWTKAGIMYKLNLRIDTTKQVLPSVSYYCTRGPWRTCWIKLGYNPVLDYTSRNYQCLEYRIRQGEGMHLKIKAKRSAKRTIAKDFFQVIKNAPPDINYIIRPNQVPPARQMFYQYCDILIPEVQEMLMKLPKLPAFAKFDPKTGWMPLSFHEHCREIVNHYVYEAVHKELLKNIPEPQTMEKTDAASYCSSMLSNIKRGILQNTKPAAEETIVDEISLSDDEEIDANVVMDSLPERIQENDEDEEDDESDLEIDMEVLEEVNELVQGIAKDGVSM